MFKPTKITTLLLIALLLMMSAGNVFGVLICESGCSSAVHHENHDGDVQNHDVNEYAQISYHRQMLKSGDSCRDYLIQLSDVFFKKGASVKSPRNATISFPLNIFLSPVNSSLSVSHAYLKSPLIIFKSILALRTVVLLY